MDKNDYLSLWNSSKKQGENNLIRDQYFLDLESHYVLMLTTDKGQKMGVRRLPFNFVDNIIPLETLPLPGGYKLQIIKSEDALNEWQKINFPGIDVQIFDNYNESNLFDSLSNGNKLLINGNSYKLTDLLGYGKEAKVFKALDSSNKEVALKTGIIFLEDEVKFAENIKEKLKDDKCRVLFPTYHAFDKEKNIIVMDYIKGQTLDDYIAEKLENGESLEKLLLLYANTVKKICELKEDKNILYGQFNLENIIVDNEESIKFIDPLYNLPHEKYDTLQIIRIGAILAETFYGLRDSNLPEKAKKAISLEELRRVDVSDCLLNKLEETNLLTKNLVDYKTKDIIRKCLIPKSRLENLNGLKYEFEELENIILNYFPEFNQKECDRIKSDELIKFNKYMGKEYRAVALDFDNTLSLDELTDKYLLKRISNFLEKKINVAIVSGRRSIWINRFIKDINPFLQDNNCLKYLHFYNSEGAIGQNIGTKEIYYEKLFDSELMNQVKKGIKKKFPQINFDTQFRTDGYRLNFDLCLDVNELNELFRKYSLPVTALNSATSVDVLPEEINKGVALKDFTSRLHIDLDDTVKIADQGQKNGNDYSLLMGQGSFSVNNYEANSDQVSTYEVLHLKKIFATAWLLDNLKFRAEEL
jgi:HAD superfamily hydrolase (TIGR01484 family)